MKYQELVQEIKNRGLRRAYVLYGEDEGQIREVVELIEEKVAVASTDVFNYIRLDGQKAEWSALQDALWTLPFLGDKKFVEIYRADFFTGNAVYKDWEQKIRLVEDFLKEPPKETTLVVTFLTELEKKDSRVKALEKKADSKLCAVVKFPALKKENALQFIDHYLTVENRSLSPHLKTYLKESFEGSLLQLEQDLDKIFAYCAGREVEKRDVDLLLTQSGTRHKYDLTDLVLSGKAKEAVLLYNELMEKRGDPHEILETIGWRLREAYQWRVRIACGLPLTAIMKELNERLPWLAERKMNTYRTLSLRRLSQMFRLLVQTEERMKGSPTDPFREMEMLILTLCATHSIR
ncbi:hypothetical protein ABB02_02048 [Clostridiaceae bacterium JG1575]|nr:hypothetical protein ABB02_02048 [Clostridiaceae bacterium JG1575]